MAVAGHQYGDQFEGLDDRKRNRQHDKRLVRTNALKAAAKGCEKRHHYTLFGNRCLRNSRPGYAATSQRPDCSLNTLCFAAALAKEALSCSKTGFPAANPPP